VEEDSKEPDTAEYRDGTWGVPLAACTPLAPTGPVAAAGGMAAPPSRMGVCEGAPWPRREVAALVTDGLRLRLGAGAEAGVGAWMVVPACPLGMLVAGTQAGRPRVVSPAWKARPRDANATWADAHTHTQHYTHTPETSHPILNRVLGRHTMPRLTMQGYTCFINKSISNDVAWLGQGTRTLKVGVGG
jgi:hypothetical protein